MRGVYQNASRFHDQRGRGHFGSGTAVGAALWQTPGGVVSEIKRIGDDIQLFSAEITDAVSRRGFAVHDPLTVTPVETVVDTATNLHTGHNLDTTSDPIVVLFRSTWTPFAHRWREFFSDNKGWTDNFWWNHAPEAEDYQKQLVEIRKHAEEAGLKLTSPTPIPFSAAVLLDPHHNVVDDANELARKAASAAEQASKDAWTLAKVAVYGVLGIGGLIAITSIASNIKKGSDPLEKYTNLYRGLRR